MTESTALNTTENFAQLLEEDPLQQRIYPGTLVRGIIVRMDKDHVVVDAKLKSESLIPIEQFYNSQGVPEVQLGDTVDVMVEAIEDGFGETRLSREKAKRAEAWSQLQQSHDQQTNVKGLVTGKVKGGFTVDLGIVRGFLPGSLVDIRPTRDASGIEGKELEFKIIKLDSKRNNIVLSRRAVLECEGQAGRELLLANLIEGQTIKGVVKNLAEYGAFIDLGGIDGLLHLIDLSWKRVKHPRDILTIGDEIEVVVLKIDQERGRVSLGLKQLSGDPWTNLVNRYQVNTRLMGRVTNITDYGCFVEIEEGVEGLVHISEMDWTNKNINPSKIVQVEMEIEVMILDIDPERRRIALGIKQCKENPWISFNSKYVKGDRISGKIKSITDFGLFVGLEGGIDGLVHLSDISGHVASEEVMRHYKKGDMVETVILSIDTQRERVSLGIKQLEAESQTKRLDQYTEGSWVKGIILECDAQDIRVDLGDQVEGYLKNTQSSTQSQWQIGDVIEAQVTGIDRKGRYVQLDWGPAETA